MKDHKDKSFIYNANSLRDSIPPFRTWICKALKYNKTSSKKFSICNPSSIVLNQMTAT